MLSATKRKRNGWSLVVLRQRPSRWLRGPECQTPEGIFATGVRRLSCPTDSCSFQYYVPAQLCPAFCDPMGCSPPGSSVHGISQARILEWVAISYSRGSFQPRDRTLLSCITGRFFTAKPPGKPIGSSI